MRKIGAAIKAGTVDELLREPGFAPFGGAGLGFETHEGHEVTVEPPALKTDEHRRRKSSAEDAAAQLTGLPLAHARHTPPPRPEVHPPTPACPVELARQVNATGLLPVDMFGNATTDDAERVRLAMNASRICGGAIFFLSTPGFLSIGRCAVISCDPACIVGMMMRSFSVPRTGLQAGLISVAE